MACKEMKKVLIDFSNLGSMCGFGEICYNYAHHLAQLKLEDMHFVFLVPKEWVGHFGDNVDYVEDEKKYRHSTSNLPKVDLWHSTDQQYHYRSQSKDTINVLTIHDVNFIYEKPYWKRWRYIWKLQHRIKGSDYITTITNYVNNDICNHLNLYGKQSQVIHNGVRDMAEDAESIPSFVKDPHEKFFFTIGQIRSKKNFHVLVQLMKYFPDHRLYISGDDHFDYADVIRDYIEKEGCGRSFLTGKISPEEKKWLYKNCDAFLFPSKLEGFGIPIIEAMRFGRAVFSSKCSSLPEVCGKYAFMWDNFEPEYMAEIIHNGLDGFYENKEQIEEMKRYAYEFSYEHYTDEYVSLYRRLLDKK